MQVTPGPGRAARARRAGRSDRARSRSSGACSEVADPDTPHDLIARSPGEGGDQPGVRQEFAHSAHEPRFELGSGPRLRPRSALTATRGGTACPEMVAGFT